MVASKLAQAVREADYSDFGFLIIRTTYGDEVQFEKWGEEFSNVLEKSVVEGSGNEDMLDKLMTAFIDDAELHNADWEGIRVFFDECAQNDMVPPGLDVGFCLAVDQEAIDSLLKPKEGIEPWVWAVDTEVEDEETRTGEYPGHFKIAVASVITDFYPSIAREGKSGEDLWKSESMVWKGEVCVSIRT